MNATVVWIRHGTCRDGLERPEAHARPDSPLTECGARDIRVAAARLPGELGDTPALVASSPLHRAAASARLLARAWELSDALLVDEFTEWRAPDCVRGVGPREYPPAYLRWKARRDHDIDAALPGGENLRHLAERARRSQVKAQALAVTYGEPVAVVAHRLLIGCVAALVHGLDEPADIFRAASAWRLPPAGWWIDGEPGPRF